MQKGQAGILILIGLLVIAVVAGGAYYLTKFEGKFCGGIAANLSENKCPLGYTCKLEGNFPDAAGKCVSLIKPSSLKTSTLNPQVQHTPSPTDASPAPNDIDKIANWKTYTNTKYGFSFKYPPKTISIEESEGEDGSSIDLIFSKDNCNAHFCEGVLISIIPLPPEYLSLSEILIRGYAGPGVLIPEEMETENITIGGVSGFAGNVPFSADTWTYQAYIRKEGKLYKFELTNLTKNNEAQNKRIFNFMLSTFEFLK